MRSGVDVWLARVQHRHSKRFALVVEQLRLTALTGCVPERVPTVLKAGWIDIDLVIAPADPGRVDDVRNCVARANVVEGALDLFPDVLLEVWHQLFVERLEQLAPDEL